MPKDLKTFQAFKNCSDITGLFTLEMQQDSESSKYLSIFPNTSRITLEMPSLVKNWSVSLVSFFQILYCFT